MATLRSKQNEICPLDADRLPIEGVCAPSRSRSRSLALSLSRSLALSLSVSSFCRQQAEL